MKISNIIYSILLLSVLAIACGEKEEEQESKKVNVNLQLTVGEDALMHETTYTINDVDVQFTNVAFYLGDMKFETSDSKSYESMERYYLVKPGIYGFNFEIPAEEENDDISLSRISFFVGVDEVTNSETEMDFTERAIGDPLGQQNPSMHWGWTGGYRFLNIDANADLDGDGEFETPLTYHLGKDVFLKYIELNPNAKLQAGPNDFDINFDIAAFLAYIDFATEQFTKAQPDNIAIAETLLGNYNSSFTFK